MRLFDSHAHYDDEKFDQDREEIIQKIYDSGVEKFISAGYSLESSKRAIELADKYEQIEEIKRSIAQKILTLSEIIVL